MAAPTGNRNAAKARDWADALRWTLENYEAPGVAKGQALRKLARVIIEKGVKGDLQAISEVANRLDGKALQPVEMDATFRNTDISSEPLTQDEWVATYGRPAAN